MTIAMRQQSYRHKEDTMVREFALIIAISVSGAMISVRASLLYKAAPNYFRGLWG